MSDIERPLVYLDFETTALGPHAQAWEVSWCPDRPKFEVRTLYLPHTLVGADPVALEINGYWKRSGHSPATPDELRYFARELHQVTVCGANPRFDVEHVVKQLGFEPCHYRLLDIESYAMPILGYTRPQGLKTIANDLTLHGYVIDDPDHTSAGDVRTLRTCHKALEDLGAKMRTAIRAGAPA